MTDSPHGGSAVVQTALTFWRAPWEFAVHAIVGTCIFAIIAAAAVVLDVGLRVLGAKGVDIVILLGLRAAEYALFATDLGLFAVFLWRTARRAIPNL